MIKHVAGLDKPRVMMENWRDGITFTAVLDALYD